VKYFNNEDFETRRYDTELAKWTAAQIKNQKSLSCSTWARRRSSPWASPR
jgi:ABC-type transport system involved in Fe-S cluster assembly fused permease/ATPase subunit